MLQEQLSTDSFNEVAKEKRIYYGSFEPFKASYTPNGLWEVTCYEKKTDKKVALPVNKNTVLVHN